MSGRKIISLLLVLIFSSHAWATEEDPFPSHCHNDEHVYLNAKMDYESDAKGSRLSDKQGVILSICANSRNEPINAITVRYGIIGAPELELRGSLKKRVKISLERSGPSMARQIFIFSTDRRAYYITEGVGLEHGVSFYAIEGKKTITYGESSEYQHGQLEIDFRSPKSPVFIRERPRYLVP